MERQGTGATWHTDGETRESRPEPTVGTEPPAPVDGKEQGVQQLTRQAQEGAGKLADGAQRQIMTQLTSQKDRATATLDRVAQAMRDTGKHLHEHDQTPFARYTDQAADQVERASAYLSQRDVMALRRELEQFARTRTPLFVAGALAAGWLGARFLKSGTPSGAQHPAAYSSTTPNAVGMAKPL